MSRHTGTTEEQWYITTDVFARNGKVYKGLGPFVTQDLALRVRAFVEQAEGHNRLFVDRPPRSLTSGA